MDDDWGYLHFRKPPKPPGEVLRQKARDRRLKALRFPPRPRNTMTSALRSKEGAELIASQMSCLSGPHLDAAGTTKVAA